MLTCLLQLLEDGVCRVFVYKSPNGDVEWSPQVRISEQHLRARALPYGDGRIKTVRRSNRAFRVSEPLDQAWPNGVLRRQRNEPALVVSRCINQADVQSPFFLLCGVFFSVTMPMVKVQVHSG
ncbi:hypothetical protein PGTUg99_009741 [Puccinia graminis f. sp. tritici]|uniref:Uncharacterized protein n=1 Tax=Puccinia graminis f. sp. tritici TaxID=56615 RepID=A0A5B0R7K2_PUCGR|nr:hypothetical protein PGTUg99_009741 [Puccinia graminis f. sp. tritici]